MPKRFKIWRNFTVHLMLTTQKKSLFLKNSFSCSKACVFFYSILPFYRNKISSLTFSLYFLFYKCYQIKKFTKKIRKSMEHWSNLAMSFSFISLSLSLLHRRNMKFHSNLLNFLRFFSPFPFFSYSKLIFCSLRNLIYIEIVYFSPFSVLSVPVLLNVADKIRFVSF